MRRGRLAAVGHQRPDERGTDAQVRDPVTLDQGPEPIRPGVVGRSLVDAERGAEHRCPGHRPRTHHPAHVGEPEEGVAGLQVEAMGQVHGSLDREAAVDVQRPLGPAGGARGVDDHERVVRVGGHRVQGLRRGRCHGSVPPDVAPLVPAHLGAGVPHDQASGHGGRMSQRLVSGRLHGHRLAATREAVGGDEQGGLAVGEPAGDRIGPVAGEDRGVDRAELADGKDRDHRLRDHGQEDADPVPPPHAQLGDRARRPVHRPAQLGTGEAADLAVLALPDERQLVGSLRRRLVDRHPHVVEARPAEPACPFDAAGRVQHDARLRIEPDSDVLDRRLPEPRGVGHGASLERLEVIEAMGAQEAGEAAALEIGRRGSPGRGVGIGPEDRTGHIARTPSRLRAMTMRWISLVPSPISVSFASRR